MWLTGIMWSNRGRSIGQCSFSTAAPVRSARCVIMAALGWPVVPEVKISTAVSSSPTAVAGGVEVAIRPPVAAGQELVRHDAACERLVQHHQPPDGRALPHQGRQLPSVVAAVNAAEGDQDRGLGEPYHVPEFGHAVARVAAGPDGAGLGRAEHERQPLGRRRRQRGDTIAAGHAGREQGPGPAGDGPVEIAVAEPRRTVDSGLALRLACGMKAHALSDPPGIDGQGVHAPVPFVVIRSHPSAIAPSGHARSRPVRISWVKDDPAAQGTDTSCGASPVVP